MIINKVLDLDNKLLSSMIESSVALFEKVNKEESGMDVSVLEANLSPKIKIDPRMRMDKNAAKVKFELI